MRQIELLDLMVEPDEYKVYRVVASQKELIDLPKLSFELLMFLIDHAEKICSLEKISEAVWGKRVVNNETIVQRITLLRKSLQDDPKAPKYIESVRGRGYRLIVRPVFLSNNKHPRLSGWRNIGIIAMMIAGVGAGAVYALFFDNTKESQPSDQSDAGTSYASPSNTNTSNSGPMDSGLNSSLNTGSLSPAQSLIERGHYYFDIGQKTNIDSAIALFQEALIMEPDNQEALVGLSRAMSKAVCRYNQPRELALEANMLAAKAVPVEATSNNKSKAEAALAYSWDCLGNLDRALEHYLLSISFDPDNHSSIGSASHLFEIKGDLLKAYQLSLKAKQLKPDNHMADLQLARLYELLKFPAQAENRYQELFVLYPDNVFINEAYPRFLYFQGRLTEAKTRLETVLKRGVERSEIFLYYGELVWLLEGQEQALNWFDKAVEINPGDSYPNTVQQLFNEQLSIEEAGARIRKLEGFVNEGDRWPVNFIEAALIALWVLDDQGLAITLLQRAVDLGYLNSEYLTISPLYAGLHNNPGFYQLIDDINRRREHMHTEFLAQYSPPEP